MSSWPEMFRTAVLSVSLLAATTYPAAADDRAPCHDVKADAESRLAACGRAIASARWSGTELARLHVARASILERQRAFDRALADCDAALAADPRHAPGYRCRGAVHYERKEYDRAIADQDRALSINPRFAGAYWERGRAFAAKDDHARALADYNEAIKINPKYANPYNGRGFILLEQGDFDGAIAELSEAIRLAPKYTSAYVNRSRAFSRKRQFDRALADAQEAVRIDPQLVRAHLRLGYALKEVRNFDDALATFNRAAALDPSSPWPPVGRGDVFLDKKDYDRAIAEFVSAIGFDPVHGRAYAGRAFANYRKGDLDRALADVHEAFKHGARTAATLNTRALVLHARRDYDEAIADLTEAVRLDPAYVHAHNNRGRAYNAKKEFDLAIRDLNEAIRLDPASPNPYWNRAISYENKRDLTRALADWRTTLRLDPQNKDAIKAIQRLERELASPTTPHRRVALVIGNAGYKYGGRLANPVNDASDFAAVLRRLGFDVVEGHDLDKRGMEEKIEQFGRKLDRASIGLFFYAGHGMQMDGDNWLLPIDARLEAADLRPDRAVTITTASINIAQVLTQMEAEQRVNLIFLDACRDSPFGRASGIAQPKGLAPIQNAVGTLTAFATKPYHVALDGEGRNSPFTAALLKHVATPGLEIGAVLKRVRADVLKTTSGQQVPFDESSLITDIVLAQ